MTKFLTSILVLCILAPINGFVEAGTISKIWDWLCAKQYGPGPAFSTWYGFMSIAGLIFAFALSNVKKAGDEDTSFVATLVGLSVGAWILCGVSLGMTFFVGSICGWI